MRLTVQVIIGNGTGFLDKIVDFYNVDFRRKFYAYFGQDYEQASHTTHVVCVKFYAWIAEPRFYCRLRTTDFWETFSWQMFLLSQSLAEIFRNRRRNICLYLCFDIWSGIRNRVTSKEILTLCNNFVNHNITVFLSGLLT